MRALGAFYALTLGAISWVLSFLLTEYIKTSPELYLFPGIISGILSGFLIVFFMNYYVKKYRPKDWFKETFIIGMLIAFFVFAIDLSVIVAFGRNPIVMISYPLYILFSVFGGYLTKRK